MDPDLKAYLDEMRQELVGRIDGLDAKIDTADTGLRTEMQEMDRRNRTLHEATQRQLKAAEEGRQAILEQIGRRFEEHDRTWDERVQPIGAVGRINSDDLRAIKHDVAAIRGDMAGLRKRDVGHEARIAALEHQRSRG